VATSLKITGDLVSRIRSHAIESYPHECCGALFGREKGSEREVLALVPLVNRREDSPRNRFSLTPDDVRHAEQMARDQGLDVIGWYHSHPDSPAHPSEFDRAHAWPWYSYVIVRSEAQATKEMTAWRLADDRSTYSPEAIEIAARAPA
jgi:proteasome lid subunit RPN8/RPN11